MKWLPVLLLAAGVAGSTTAPAEAGVEIRVGTLAPEGSRYMRDMEAMASELERLTGGEVKLKFFPGGALGDDAEMVELLEQGKLDGGGFTDAGMSLLVPETRAWIFPALFDSPDELDYMQRRMRPKFDQLFAKRGYQLLFWGDVGFTHVFSRYKIASLADLRQHRIWLWSNDQASIYFADQAKLPWRASTIRVLTDDLAAGRVDTWQFPPLAAVAFGIHRYPKYVSELRYRYMIGGLIIRDQVFRKLTPSQQRALRALTAKWEHRFTTGWRVDEQKALEVMRKGGVQLVKMGDAQRQEFYQEAARHRDEWASHYGITGMMNEFVDALREYRELHR